MILTQTWISDGSARLYLATKKYAYVKKVRILIPETWTEIEAELSEGLSLEVRKYSIGILDFFLHVSYTKTAN